MKNIGLIKSTVAAYLQSVDSKDLLNNIVTIILAHPEDVRENILALLTGNATLTVRPKEQVEIPSNDKDYFDFKFDREPAVNLLKGTVECQIRFKKKTISYFKSEEDRERGIHGSWKHDVYQLAKEFIKDDFSYITFNLSDWNKGQVYYK